MKFREYGEVKPITLISPSPRLLDRKIERLGQKADIIDLQFASCTTKDGDAEYSALVLVRLETNKQKIRRK